MARGTKKIAQAINGYFDQCNLEEMYNWEIPDGCPIEIPIDRDTDYKKNIYLKQNLKKKLMVDDEDNFLDVAYWIIQQWGGIRSYGKTKANDVELKNLRNMLKMKKPDISQIRFEAISSLSKVASFLNPNQYAIFDSRVAYSLNWLLFLYAQDWLFRQPESQNSHLRKHQLETIFHLYDGTNLKVMHLKKNECYLNYCAFLQAIKKELRRLRRKTPRIYEIEMLLFTIAPTFITEDHCCPVNFF